MIHEFLDLLRTLTDPDQLRALLTTVMSGWWSYALLFSIIFAETGLLAGFFLPGDSLLFTIGVLAGAGDLNLPLICSVLILAAILGDGMGYLLGLKVGLKIFDRPDSRLFRREYVDRTHAFYEKHGGKTIIYARFIPIIRTFAPFVAGMAGMGYRRFAAFNVIGGVGWVLSMTVAGYLLGNVGWVRHNFEKVVIGIVLLSVLPVFFEYWKSRREVPAKL